MDNLRITVKNRLMTIFLLIFLISFSAHGSEILDFKTDLCTYFPEGTYSSPNLWKHCCIEHDLYYWVGGIKTKQDLADIKLRECVKKASNDFYGNLMYRGVVLGHLSPVKNQYKWAWGHNNELREFEALTKTEKEKAKQSLLNSHIDPQIIDKFINENLSK